MKRFLKLALVLLVLGALAGGGYWWVHNQRITNYALTPFGTASAKTLDIKPGTGPKALAAELQQAGIIENRDLLYAWLRREKLGPKLKAGEYEFIGPITPENVIAKIIK